MLLVSACQQGEQHFRYYCSMRCGTKSTNQCDQNALRFICNSVENSTILRAIIMETCGGFHLASYPMFQRDMGTYLYPAFMRMIKCRGKLITMNKREHICGPSTGLLTISSISNFCRDIQQGLCQNLRALVHQLQFY